MFPKSTAKTELVKPIGTLNEKSVGIHFGNRRIQEKTEVISGSFLDACLLENTKEGIRPMHSTRNGKRRKTVKTVRLPESPNPLRLVNPIQSIKGFFVNCIQPGEQSSLCPWIYLNNLFHSFGVSCFFSSSRRGSRAPLWWAVCKASSLTKIGL